MKGNILRRQNWAAHAKVGVTLTDLAECLQDHAKKRSLRWLLTVPDGLDKNHILELKLKTFDGCKQRSDIDGSDTHCVKE